MRMMTMMGLGIVLVACGDDGLPPIEKPATKVLVRTDAAGEQCAHGGSVISSGVDANGNGRLEDGEIQVRTPVCDPAPGEPEAALTRLVPELPGAHCAEGGTAIESGIDLDRDGVLDDGEVTRTDYVCGEVLLTRLSPAGGRCTAGGVAIDIGRDRDHDGRLADGEVEHTELACGDVLTRDVNATTAAEVAALADIAVVRGNLTVVATFPSVVLPKLQVVTGTFDVHGSQISELSAPELTRVDGHVKLLTAKLPTATLPKLASVGGELDIMGNLVLTAVSLPSLTTVGSHFDFESNVALQTIDAPIAHIGGALRLIDCPQLGAQSFTLDAPPADVFLRRSGLTSFRLVTDSVDDRPLDVTFDDNPALASAELRAVRLDKIALGHNAQLATLTLHAQDVTGDLRISESPALAQLVLDSGPDQPFHVAGDVYLDAPIATLTAGPLDVGGVLTAVATQLTELDVSAAGGLELRGNPVIAAVHASALTTLGSLVVDGNPVLAELSLPALTVGGDVLVTGNAALEHLGLAALTRVITLGVTQNPHLPACEVDALFAHVTGVRAQSGNDTTATCTP